MIYNKDFSAGNVGWNSGSSTVLTAFEPLTAQSGTFYAALSNQSIISRPFNVIGLCSIYTLTFWITGNHTNTSVTIPGILDITKIANLSGWTEITCTLISYTAGSKELEYLVSTNNALDTIKMIYVGHVPQLYVANGNFSAGYTFLDWSTNTRL